MANRININGVELTREQTFPYVAVDVTEIKEGVKESKEKVETVMTEIIDDTSIEETFDDEVDESTIGE